MSDPADRRPGDVAARLRVRLSEASNGSEYELAVVDGCVQAPDLASIKVMGHGLASYDPGLFNTAVCRSAITYIDGEIGVLTHRGYPIEELGAGCSFVEVAYLLAHGVLPDTAQATAFDMAAARGAVLPSGVARLIDTFPPDAHPMTVLLAAWSALPAYRTHAAELIRDPLRRAEEVPAIIGAIAGIVGYIVARKWMTRPDSLGDAPGFSERLFSVLSPALAAGSEPVFAEALDLLLIIQADHEQNCSTNAVRSVGSSHVDPYTAIAAGIAALAGPLHGGANEAVIRMLEDIGDQAHVPAFVDSVRRGDRLLMGFGHRVYKNYDPRARLIKSMLDRILDVIGRSDLAEVAETLEMAALQDPYFVDRRLYPNVDFYSGLVYRSLGIPTDAFTAVFAVSRTAGWIAQWLEMIDDPEQKIVRPRQIYVGQPTRSLPSHALAFPRSGGAS